MTFVFFLYCTALTAPSTERQKPEAWPASTYRHLRGVSANKIDVGLIQTILVKKEKVYFVTKKFTAARNWLNYFESKKSENIPVFIESCNLADFKPLFKKGTTEKFIFVLHHHVSFLYQ